MYIYIYGIIIQKSHKHTHIYIIYTDMHVPTLLSTITAIDKLFLRFSAIKALDLLLFLWFFVVARSSVNSGSGSGWTSKRLMPKTTTPNGGWQDLGVSRNSP